MALTAAASGTQTATIGTEHSLSTQTTTGAYVLMVDLGAMAHGDAVELRIYATVLSGGTERLAYSGAFMDVQDEPITFSVPVPGDVNVRAALIQTNGTGRSYPWKMYRM